jgi:hypothetical protein
VTTVIYVEALLVDEEMADQVWDPQPDTLTPAGPDPPLPQGETLSLTYHPVPDIA